MSPNEASAGNEFSSAIGKHSSDSSRGVKVIRHRVAPFDIFPRAPFSRITIGTRGGGGGGWILTDRSEKLLCLSIYIYIYPSSRRQRRDEVERSRANSVGRKKKRWKKRSSWWPSRSTPIHGDWIVWEASDWRVVTRRNVEKCWNVAALFPFYII